MSEDAIAPPIPKEKSVNLMFSGFIVFPSSLNGAFWGKMFRSADKEGELAFSFQQYL